jgi:hypothetical protein
VSAHAQTAHTLMHKNASLFITTALDAQGLEYLLRCLLQSKMAACVETWPPAWKPWPSPDNGMDSLETLEY